MKQASEKRNYTLSVLRLVLVTLFIALLALVSLVGYSNSMTLRLIDSSFGTLGEVTQQQAFNFESHIASDVADLKTIAYSTNFFSVEEGDVQAILDDFAAFSNFDFISVYDLSGLGVDPAGNSINLNSYFPLDGAEMGQTIVGDSITFSPEFGPVLPIVTPIYDTSNNISGFLLGTYPLDKLQSLILSSFDGSSYFYIVDSTGDIILSTVNDYALLNRQETGNLLEFMAQDVQIESYDDLVTVSEKIRDGESGYFSWSLGDEVRYTYYMPTGVNDWYIFSFVPEETLLSTNSEIAQSTLIFAFASFATFLLLSAFIMYLRARDARRQREHAMELEKIAYYDDLTGLANQLLFKKQMERHLQEHPDVSFSLLKFDIEQFKLVNEILGSETGDRVLKTIGDICKDLMNTHSGMLFMARTGSDDFLVLGKRSLLEGKDSLSDYEAIEERVHELCDLKLRYRLRFRYGRCAVSPDIASVDSALENVNLAHSTAKKTGRKFVDYDVQLTHVLVHESELENRMQQALLDGEFLVYLQPKYNLKLRVIQGAEALVRWQTKEAASFRPASSSPFSSATASSRNWITICSSRAVCSFPNGKNAGFP